VLARARNGVFNQLEVNRGLPMPMLVKFFDKAGLDWQVKADIRKMINFRKVNLMEAWPAMPEMDVVFMRNVLIYFDIAQKKRIFERLARVIRPGRLFVPGDGGVDAQPHRPLSTMQVGKATCYQRIT